MCALSPNARRQSNAAKRKVGSSPAQAASSMEEEQGQASVKTDHPPTLSVCKDFPEVQQQRHQRLQ